MCAYYHVDRCLPAELGTLNKTALRLAPSQAVEDMSNVRVKGILEDAAKQSTVAGDEFVIIAPASWKPLVDFAEGSRGSLPASLESESAIVSCGLSCCIQAA